MIKTYYLLTKPGIILGNIVTTAAGFFLASKNHIDWPLFLYTLAGLALVIGSACVFNNYTDRNADKKMERTKNRGLPSGLISGVKAIIFALLLLLSGVFILFYFVNFLCVLIAIIGFCIYVILYGIFKYLTIHGTLIGSLSGGIPPVVGYCAASNNFDLGALLLFLIVVVWQMPHFFSIAIYRFDDYLKVAIPVLPIQKGVQASKTHILIYIIAFIFLAPMLTFFGYTGYFYLITSLLLGLIWLGICLKGLKRKDNKIWARKMFFFSLVCIAGLSLAISFDTLG